MPGSMPGTRSLSRLREGAEEFVDPSNPRMRYYNSRLGRVTLSKAGAHQLALKPESIDSRRKGGLSLASIKLVPVK